MIIFFLSRFRISRPPPPNHVHFRAWVDHATGYIKKDNSNTEDSSGAGHCPHSSADKMTNITCQLVANAIICNGTVYVEEEEKLTYLDEWFWIYLGIYVGLVLIAGK